MDQKIRCEGTGRVPLAGCCEDGNEHCGFINGGELYHLGVCESLKVRGAMLNHCNYHKQLRDYCTVMKNILK
jgi:hypothetical protein